MRRLRRNSSPGILFLSLPLVLFLILLGFAPCGTCATPPASTRFEVRVPKSTTGPAQSGRVFVILAQTNQPEPRFQLGRNGPDAPIVLARDVPSFGAGNNTTLDDASFAFPPEALSTRREGNYSIQALFDSNKDLRSPNAPGNFYSRVLSLAPISRSKDSVQLDLTEQIPAEQLPPDTEYLKFVRIQSPLLTKFHGRPIFLRAGVVLPRDFQREPNRRYPLWIQIGGLNTRYSIVTRLMKEGSSFRKTWLADNTPRFLLLQVDGAGPYGDPYQINSDNSGPYGDALIKELIPFVESKYRALASAQTRVLSGTSTGGWVCLALQIFYPDFFNGAWSSSPDPVDFRAFELVNIYADKNAYIDQQGRERPSERSLDGEAILTMRQEVAVENLLGRGNNYTCSGQQWGEWNVAFGPRGTNGRPVPLWDAESGKIDAAVAQHWTRYDLSLFLQQNWPALAPRLRNKLHIAVGEADEYFLNQAVHLLEQRMSKANPPFEAKIVYGPGQGHGWMDLTLEEMLKEMDAATRAGY